MSLPNGIDAISRRRFLTLLSASASLAIGSSCSKIDRGTIVPYTRRPGEIIPGVATYYASTFQEGLTTLGVLVKTREGRPIHIEGNGDHPLSRGKSSLRGMGDLLGLYDPDRLRSPKYKNQSATWDEAIKSMTKVLSDARLLEKPVLLLTGAILSPTQKALLYDLKLALPSLHHAAWEPAAPISAAAASTSLFGKTMFPQPHLDRADVVLALQSDFLGVDAAAPIFIQDFASRRMIAEPKAAMNRLWVFEGSMTLTGANADQRVQIKPSKIAMLAFAIARHLNESHSIPLPDGIKSEDLNAFELGPAARKCGIDPALLKLLIENLAKARNAALVLAGPELSPETHIACHLLNSMLGAEGNTLEQGIIPVSDIAGFRELQSILKEAAEGKYGAGIFWGANPAYAFPDQSLWKRAVARIPDTYRIGLYEDETALDCGWRLPENHWLESWGDFDPLPDYSSLRQPVIGTLHDSRQGEEILISCLRKMKIQGPKSYLDYLKLRWRSDVCPVGGPVPFDIFWNAALHDGGARREPSRQPPLSMNTEAIKRALKAVKDEVDSGTESMEIILAPGSSVYDGRYANNGWLNELPDPVTKATWGNPLLLSAADAERLGVKEHETVRISVAGKKIEAPVLVQHGQTPGVASLALGYGHTTGTVAVAVGANAYPLINAASKTPYLISNIELARIDGKKSYPAPKTQDYERMDGRDLVRSWTLREYAGELKKKEHGNENHGMHSLIPNPRFSEQKWGMVIDLSACTGCSACVVACQSENNIPVVGPDRISVGRGMHWIRIDRYYEGDLGNPKVLHQPMLCQHCDNAPCEIVCPVNATTHSPDGLNQMAYNRCVGTRYCSNNCPFKVRRFNFFDYTSMKKEPETLMFNPEVTVRPRGVMEKCTFCVQRIQNAKQNAKSESRQIRDGEIQTACAAACPANAIVFGNLNDPQSRVSRLTTMNRQYRLLEELGIRPSVTYLADVSNPANTKDKA